MADDAVYSFVPSLILLALALVLLLGYFLAHYGALRLPAFSPLACLTLLGACYFFVCGCRSYSCLEGDLLCVLVLGACVFYGLAYGLAAYPSTGRVFSWVLVAGILLNGLYVVLAHVTEASLVCWGRTVWGLEGQHARPCALFLYKNVASTFLLVCGGFLVLRVLLLRLCCWGAWWQLVLGLGAVGLSCCCASRVPYLLLPAMLFWGWFLSLLFRWGARQRLLWWDALLLALILLGAGAGIYDLLGAQQGGTWLLGVDSHLRFEMWAAVCKILPSAPLCGYGAGAAQWEVLPYFCEWSSPNYAHQEYLQCWADAGCVGFFLLLALLLLHVLRGFCLLLADPLPVERRATAAACLLMLLLLCLYAALDFVWHQWAMLMLSAWLAGYLAYPTGAELHLWHCLRGKGLSASTLSSPLAMGRWAKRCCLVVILVLLAVACYFIVRFAPAYGAERRYDAALRAGIAPEVEFALLEDAIALYPDAAIASWALRLKLPKTAAYYRRVLGLLEPCLQANPRNLFTVVLMADVLGRLGEFDRAEALMRVSYPEGGVANSPLCSWASYYGLNLLAWGVNEAAQGHHAKAYSLLAHALAMHARAPLLFHLDYRAQQAGHQDVEQLRAAYQQDWQRTQQLITLCRECVAEYQRLRLKPDHRWKQPHPPSTKLALYDR